MAVRTSESTSPLSGHRCTKKIYSPDLLLVHVHTNILICERKVATVICSQSIIKCLSFYIQSSREAWLCTFFVQCRQSCAARNLVIILESGFTCQWLIDARGSSWSDRTTPCGSELALNKTSTVPAINAVSVMTYQSVSGALTFTQMTLTFQEYICVSVLGKQTFSIKETVASKMCK
jgi:hypothetical protein